jgi:hypothetical protein
MTMAKRSGEAVAAQHRKAGPMAHRLKPRGGAKNDQPELLEEAEGVVVDDVLRDLIERACERRAESYGELLVAAKVGEVDEYSRGAVHAWDEIISLLKKSR